MLAPLHQGFAFKHVDDRVLFAMMMDAGLCAGLNKKSAAPHLRVDTKFRRDGGLPQRAEGLCGAPVELAGTNDADGGGAAFRHTLQMRRPVCRSQRRFGNRILHHEKIVSRGESPAHASDSIFCPHDGCGTRIPGPSPAAPPPADRHSWPYLPPLPLRRPAEIQRRLRG